MAAIFPMGMRPSFISVPPKTLILIQSLTPYIIKSKQMYKHSRSAGVDAVYIFLLQYSYKKIKYSLYKQDIVRKGSG